MSHKVATSDSGQNNWKPNSVSATELLFSFCLAVGLLAYGAWGLLHNRFFVAPPKSRIGLALSDRPAWLFAAALFTGAVVLLSVVVDHYDKRNNESWYRFFKRGAICLGLCFLLAALVSGFYVSLVR